MSSRLFQNIREKRGLAYAVGSGLTAYQDAGALTVYAGCDSKVVSEVIELVVTELQNFRDNPIQAEELRRAKDHLKGNLVLSLESSSSRMSQMARHEMQFGRQISLDDTLASVETVTVGDIQRVARDLFQPGALAVTVLGPAGRLRAGDQFGLT